MTDLGELLDRVKAARGPDREMDGAICIALQYGGPNSEGATNVRIDVEWGDEDLLFEIGAEDCCNPIPDLTSSIDAALALVERALPERWEIDMGTCGPDDMPWACVTEPVEPCRDFASSAPTIPIAMIEALLLALEAQNGK